MWFAMCLSVYVYWLVRPTHPPCTVVHLSTPLGNPLTHAKAVRNMYTGPYGTYWNWLRPLQRWFANVLPTLIAKLSSPESMQKLLWISFPFLELQFQTVKKAFWVHTYFWKIETIIFEAWGVPSPKTPYSDILKISSSNVFFECSPKFFDKAQFWICFT